MSTSAPRVLFLTHRLPYAPNRGDRIRAYFLMREIASFAKLSLFSLVHDDDEARLASDVPFASRVVTARVPRIANYLRGIAQLPSARPLTHALLDAPDAIPALGRLVSAEPPDVVLAYCSGMARFALSPPLDRFPLVLDMVDVDSEKWRSLADRATLPKRWIYRREWRTLSAFERRAAEQAVTTLVVSEAEQASLLTIAPSAAVTVLPNGVDVEAFAPAGPPSEAPNVVFCGVMDYEPNVEGVVWFARDIWPRVRAVRPDARFTIVGAKPTSRVTRLADDDSSITVTGRVDSVQPYLWSAAVAVAPVRVARGVQNKVLEALAAGLPAVVTSAVHAGLPESVRGGCVCAPDDLGFADQVVALLQESSRSRRDRAAAAGVERLAWSAQFAPLRSVLCSATEESS